MDKLRRIKFSLYPIIAFLVYHITFVRYYYVSDYTKLTIIMIMPVAIYLMLHIKKILSEEKYKNINFLLFIFTCYVLLSSIANFHNFDSSFLFVFKLWICFLFFEYLHIINKIHNVLIIYVFLTTLYVIVSLNLYDNNVFLFYNYGKNYFIGNKFDVSYMIYIAFIMLFTFFNMKNKSNKFYKLILLLYFLFSIFVSVSVDCSTMIVGHIITFILFMIDSKTLKKNSNIIITIIISTFVLIAFSGILNITFIKNFIVNVLNKDVTLTGRMEIYSKMFSIIRQNFMFGVGYGNSFSEFMKLMSAPNAQNAIFDWIVQIGIIGTFFILLIINKIFKNIKLSDMKIYKPVIIAIYVFSILGMIEITINMLFFTLLAVVNLGFRLNEKEGEEDARKIVNKKCYI